MLVLLLLVVGASFYLFSPSGNAALKPYVKAKIEKEVGLPVKVDKFRLDAKQVHLIFTVNGQLKLEILSNYNIWQRSFAGIYRINAQNFHYEDKVLRQAALRGHMKGTIENIYVEGNGTVLDSKLTYRLLVKDDKPQQIEATMNGVALSEILALAGTKALASGRVNIDIKLPDIGKESARGHVNIALDEGRFNRKLVQKIYGYTLPKGSYIRGKIVAKLKEKRLYFASALKSNLFSLSSQKGEFDFDSQEFGTSYVVDVKDLRILTQNRLAGLMKVEGDVTKKKKLNIHGKSTSLGGNIVFDIGEKIDASLKNVALKKVLILLKQPAYARGLIGGSIAIDKDMKKGEYDLSIKQGIINTKVAQKELGYSLPSKNHFTLKSKGKVKKEVLKAQVQLRSNISDVDLTSIKYDIKTKKLFSKYDFKVQDIRVFMPKAKAMKKGALSARGEVTFDKSLSIKGKTTGLGKKLVFHYDSKSAKIDAQALSMEKLLALSGLPEYVRGKLDADVALTNIKNLEGKFTLKSSVLQTNPKAMLKLIGKPLKSTVKIDSKGTLKKGKAYVQTTLKSGLGTLELSKSVIDTKTKEFKSNYLLTIPSLKKLYVLTDKKLYGKMKLEGTLSQKDILRVNGVTHSLGGDIRYTLVGDALTSKLSMVSVSKVMAMLGMSQSILGRASGKVRYNLKQKKGVADLNIADFQVKSSSTTNTIKMFIGKDPSRIIFSSTKLHANMNGDITTYNLHAKGSRASIDITQGHINKKSGRQSAKFKFVYEKYVINGDIKGTTDNPKVVIDPASMMSGKVGKEISKGLDKVLGGNVGGFLKGFKF